MSKEAFKKFVREKPELSRLVLKGSTTWQKLYETYDLYGENATVWQEMLSSPSSSHSKTSLSSFSVLMELVKNIDLHTLQKGITGLQKAIGILQELSNKEEKTPSPYEERPIHKYYED